MSMFPKACLGGWREGSTVSQRKEKSLSLEKMAVWRLPWAGFCIWKTGASEDSSIF